jgi:hypothetical protein
MNEHDPRPETVPRIATRGFVLAGVLALLAATGPSAFGATRPPPVDACAALALCFTEHVPGFGEAGRHGLPRGGTALAGARG